MRCPNCKKEVSPLVLRAGLSCPECLKSFVNDAVRTNFKFTKENDETFHLSEAAFFRGIKERNQNRIELAIQLCRMAFEMGNPEAYIRMGYYYEKNLITEEKGKSSGTMENRYRLLIAYEYYSLVCNGLLVPGNMDKHRSFEELQKTAAERLIRLLAELPVEEQKNPRYSIKVKQSELAKKGLFDAAAVSFSDAKKQDIAITLAKDIPDMLDQQQNVLIAVYGIRGADLLTLLPEKDKKVEWKDNFLYRAAKAQDLLFRYYLNTSKTDRKANPVDAPRFEEFLEKVEKGVHQNPDCEFRLLFFNGKYKPVRFKKSSDMRKIEEALMGNSETVDKIADMNEDISRFIFYEDEVYYCVQKRGMKQLSASFWDYYRGKLE